MHDPPPTRAYDHRCALAARFAWPLLFYALFYPALRPLGAPALLLVSLCALVSCAVNFDFTNKKSYGFVLFYFTSLLVLSFFELLPHSWTLYHDNFAALRQWSWVVLLPVYISAFKNFLIRHRLFIVRHAFSGFLLLAALAFISRNFINPDLGDKVFYTLTNDAFILYALIFIWIVSMQKTSGRPLIVFAALFFLSSSTQSQFLCLFALSIYFLPYERAAPFLLLFFILIFLILSPLYYSHLYLFDANMGVRAYLWRETWQIFADTPWIGVGFGTEYISNDFANLTHDDWRMIAEQDAGRLFVSTHSAFYDLLMRGGIIGLGLYFFWFLRVIRPLGRHMGRRSNQLFALVSSMLLLMTLFNPGLNSFNFLLGGAFGFALLALLREGKFPLAAPGGTGR